MFLTSTNYFSILAINAIAEYAVHEHFSKDPAKHSEAFIELCGYCFKVVALFEPNMTFSWDPMNHFTRLLHALTELLRSQSHSGLLYTEFVSEMLLDVHNLIVAHPSLTQDFREFVEVLSMARLQLDLLYWGITPLGIALTIEDVVNRLFAMHGFLLISSDLL